MRLDSRTKEYQATIDRMAAGVRLDAKSMAAKAMLDVMKTTAKSAQEKALDRGFLAPVRMSLAEYRDNPKQRKHQKYSNKVTETPDGRFDSEAEYRHWCHLKIRLRLGEISDLQRQVVFELAPAVVIQGRKRPPLRYVADMCYHEAGKLVVADVKGAVTAEYRIKRHLMASVHGVEIREIRA